MGASRLVGGATSQQGRGYRLREHVLVIGAVKSSDSPLGFSVRHSLAEVDSSMGVFVVGLRYLATLSLSNLPRGLRLVRSRPPHPPSFSLDDHHACMGNLVD